MVSNSTLETIDYIYQAQSEQNIKLFIIFSLIIVAIIFCYLDQKIIKNNRRASFTLLKVIFKIFYWAVFLFFPLIFYLYSYSEPLAGFITVYLYYGYLMLVVFGILFGAIYGFEELLLLVGWEITLDGLKINFKHKEENNG